MRELISKGINENKGIADGASSTANNAVNIANSKGDTAINTANEAKEQADTNKDQIANIVAHNGDGTKDTELIDSRHSNITNTTYTTTGERMDGIDLTLTDNTNQFNTMTYNIKYPIPPRAKALGSGNDDTGAIQAGIDYLAGLNGGQVLIPNEMFKASNIQLKKKVFLVGLGHSSCLSQLNNTNANFITLYQISPAGGCGILNLAIDGNSANNTSGDGIYLSATQGTFLDYGAYYGDEKILLSGLRVYNTAGNGITIASGLTQTTIFNTYIQYAGGYGLYNTCTDGWFFNVFIHHAQKSGFYMNQSDNYYTNCKAWMNGIADRSLYSGWDIHGRTNSLANCEAQENYGHGFLLKDTFNIQLHGCAGEANGIISTDVNTPSDLLYNDFELQNNTNATLHVSAGDFHKRIYGKQVTNIGVHLNSTCFNNHIDLQTTDVVTKYQDDAPANSNIWKSGNAMYGGTFTANSVKTEGRITSTNGQVFANGTSGEIGLTTQLNGVKRIFLGLNTATSSNSIDVYDTSGVYIGSPLLTDFSGNTRMGIAGKNLGFYGVSPVARPSVTGSRSDGTALNNLLIALNNMGLIQNNSTT
jgi:hypothetical protein